MHKICLLSEEKAVLKEVQDSKIPSIFKTNYLDFLLTVENINCLAEDILNGKRISYDFSDEFNALQVGVDTNQLDEDTKEYYRKLIAVFAIFKKYYL